MDDATKRVLNKEQYDELVRAWHKLGKLSPSSYKNFFNNIALQEFPFLAPIMDYIYKNISAPQLLKLYQTCKCFYINYLLIIIEDFEICARKDDERVVGNSMAICLDNSVWSKLNNLCITKSFTYCENVESKQPLVLDHQKFSHLIYDSLTINGKLGVADYEFLIEPTTVRQLFVNSKIYYPETAIVLSIEEVLERAPHVSAFDMYGINSPPINMDNLIALERQTKLLSLHLYGVSTIPPAWRVVEFFEKHATPDIDYMFHFDKRHPEYNADNVETFFATINAGLRAWKTRQLPPAISSSFIDLTGKIALITACDGIGKATAILFRELGASVVVFSRNSIELKSLVEECQSIENDGSLRTFKVGSLFGCGFETLKYKFGSKIDILINYCDVNGSGGVPNIKEERKYHTKDFVKFTNFILIKCAKPYLIEAEGTMINVSNPHDLITNPKRAKFIAECKNYIEDGEAELLAAGVRINNVNSGAPVTALPRPEGMSDFDLKKLQEKSKKSHEQEIANAIALLASSKLINEHTVPINAKL